MACIYDEATLDRFYAKAVKTVDEIVVGKTYYTNCSPEKFTVVELLTNGDEYERDGLVYRYADYGAVSWIVPSEGSSISLKDNNIGAHYNPWMIFANEEDAIECREGLVVTFECIEFDRGYDDDWDSDYGVEDNGDE